ncbi:hypothetical protein A4D02_16880 [Niastella koreensis]|uniref:Uncharacterized protein n=1 Tax=Niastella koreensis TaxID=354356 RepID=A0ABX3NLT2_9BACT|nr:hypothetical protein A4D02_16880 [Niastella koreensis]
MKLQIQESLSGFSGHSIEYLIFNYLLKYTSHLNPLNSPLLNHLQAATFFYCGAGRAHLHIFPTLCRKQVLVRQVNSNFAAL